MKDSPERDALARQYSGFVVQGIISTIPVNQRDFSNLNPFQGFVGHKDLIAAIASEIAYALADTMIEKDTSPVDTVLRNQREAYLDTLGKSG
jgi:hypothetical protein